MFAYLTLLSVLAVSALCQATPAIEKRSSPAPYSNFTHNPVYYPLKQAPLWRVCYARAIQVQDGSLLLTWEDYPYGENSSNLDTFKILRSVDGGASWSNFSHVADTQNGWGMRFQPDMYILKNNIGKYPAGTLLIAGVSTPLSLTGGVYIDLYTSSDMGKSWKFASHVAYGAGPETVTTGDKSIWEPFFLEYNGKLMVYFSDQRDPAHSQKLSLTSTTDLLTWSASTDVVAYSNANARPGMAVISYLPTIGQYMLSYEYCNPPSGSGCPAHYRLASNPTEFLTATDHTLTTTSGHTPGGSPYSVWYQYPGSTTDGAVILSTNSDTDLFVSRDNASTWTMVNVNQYTGQSRHLLLFNDNGEERLHLATAGFYGCSGSCYNYVSNGVTALEKGNLKVKVVISEDLVGPTQAMQLHDLQKQTKVIWPKGVLAPDPSSKTLSERGQLKNLMLVSALLRKPSNCMRVTMDLKEKDWEIARAVKNPDRVRELLSQGHKPDAFDLCEAALHGAQCAGAVEIVEILLATGVIDPNTRPDYADLTNVAEVEKDWASSDKSSSPPEIYKDPDEWYPLHLALTCSHYPTDRQVQKRNMTQMATALLQHGADPYAIFRQTVRIYNYWLRFPGEPQDDKPDKGGVYPLIAALSRIRAYWSKTEHLGTLESAIDDLLAAGADPMVRDPRGNTALHYLALSWPDDFSVRVDEQRRLCRLLLDRGIDPNARNLDGQSALKLYFTAFETSRYQNRQGYSWNVWQDMDEPYAKINEEVLEIFEKAGANLTAQDSEGQTLLHIVAGKRTLRMYDRLLLLLSKDLDPMVRNAKGETAIDVAMSLEPSGESFFATVLKDHVEGLNG
ncbi:hypothetical protein CNMCM5623_003897 [Aspergillus felis]|uniref:Uncharacterized protein n=1 Tax=Aspergillus felis TaxID=1287682 RepID=A0A8H6PR08_9EURO|nr:hypothetical protein CNMCM5623_003897 [Aspergillus felis]